MPRRAGGRTARRASARRHHDQRASRAPSARAHRRRLPPPTRPPRPRPTHRRGRVRAARDRCRRARARTPTRPGRAPPRGHRRVRRAPRASSRAWPGRGPRRPPPRLTRNAPTRLRSRRSRGAAPRQEPSHPSLATERGRAPGARTGRDGAASATRRVRTTERPPPIASIPTTSRAARSRSVAGTAGSGHAPPAHQQIGDRGRLRPERRRLRSGAWEARNPPSPHHRPEQQPPDRSADRGDQNAQRSAVEAVERRRGEGAHGATGRRALDRRTMSSTVRRTRIANPSQPHRPGVARQEDYDRRLDADDNGIGLRDPMSRTNTRAMDQLAADPAMSIGVGELDRTAGILATSIAHASADANLAVRLDRDRQRFGPIMSTQWPYRPYPAGDSDSGGPAWW